MAIINYLTTDKNKVIFISMRKILVELSVLLILLIPVLIWLVLPAMAAGRFTQVFLRYDRMKIGQGTSATLYLVPSSVGTEAKVKIVFGTGITVAAVPTLNTTGLPAGSIALPGTLTAAGAGTSIVISGVTDLTVGTTYAVNIATGISTPASAGATTDVISTLTSGDAEIDTTTITSRFITDDQIVITGNVPPTFTFVLSGNTDTFTADLSTSIVSTNGRTVSVTTNAAKGWIGWVRSANAALSSVTSGESIGTTGTVNAAPSTCQTSSDCYVLDADLTTSGAGSGSVTIDPEYNGTDTSSGGTLSTTLQPFVSRSGKTAGDVITLIARASIIATKASASDYTDTLTVIGAGNF